MQEISMLVTSAGRRAGLIRCFRDSARELDLRLRVIACDLAPATSAACHLADASFAVPGCEDPGYVEALLEIVRRCDIQLVVPTIDPELAPLSASLTCFARHGARVHVGSPKAVDIARNKLKTAVALKEAGVPVPQTFPAEDAKALCGKHWPMFLKPAGGSSSRGIGIVRCPADVPPVHAEPMVLQQLLKGPEFTVNMFLDAQGVLRSVVPHRRLRVRGGEVEKGRTERNPVFDGLARGVANALGEAKGALCFQLILDEDMGPCVFEINARFGGGYPLAHHAGGKFAKWLLEETAMLPSSADNEWRDGVLMLRYDDAVFHG